MRLEGELQVAYDMGRASRQNEVLELREKLAASEAVLADHMAKCAAQVAFDRGFERGQRYAFEKASDTIKAHASWLRDHQGEYSAHEWHYAEKEVELAMTFAKRFRQMRDAIIEPKEETP